jgi:type I restriction enzyme S subunit
MSFSRYEAYKDSGVEWLGEVPAHWRTGKITRFAKLESGHTPSRQHPEYWENCTIPWFSLADVWQIREGKKTYVVETEERVSELGLANSSARLLPKGSVILSRTASVGFSAIMGCDMATTQDFANWVCGPRLEPEFLLAAFRGMTGEFQRLMMGSTHQTIYMPDIAKLAIAVPPINEQAAIVDFLTREAAKIDALIAEQERLIVLLREKRQAIISRAVTKGLDPNAPMKDSGVEWLGEVPAHWTVAPLGYRYEVQLGRMLNEARAEGEHMLPYLRVYDVQWNSINVEDLPLMDFPPDAQKRYRLNPGDLLVNEGGSYVGRSAIWRGELEECYYQKALHRLRPYDRDEDASEYLLHVMEMATQGGIFAGSANQTTIDHLTAEQLRAYRFAFPPLREQVQIARFLQERLRQLVELSSQAATAVSLLQERRSALISAAITGKIDVRGAIPSFEDAA